MINHPTKFGFDSGSEGERFFHTNPSGPDDGFVTLLDCCIAVPSERGGEPRAACPGQAGQRGSALCGQQLGQQQIQVPKVNVGPLYMVSNWDSSKYRYLWSTGVRSLWSATGTAANTGTYGQQGSALCGQQLGQQEIQVPTVNGVPLFSLWSATGTAADTCT